MGSEPSGDERGGEDGSGEQGGGNSHKPNPKWKTEGYCNDKIVPLIKLVVHYLVSWEGGGRG